MVDAMGVKVANKVTDPNADGTQSHVAVVVTAVTASQPVIDVPFNMKLTVPARDVVAVMRSMVRYCGDRSAIEILTDEEA